LPEGSSKQFLDRSQKAEIKEAGEKKFIEGTSRVYFGRKNPWGNQDETIQKVSRSS